MSNSNFKNEYDSPQAEVIMVAMTQILCLSPGEQERPGEGGSM